MKIVLVLLSLAGLAAAIQQQPQLKRKTGVRGVVGKKAKQVEDEDPHRRLKGDKDDNDSINVEDVLGIGCFSEVATAQVQHRGQVAMKDLKVGDQVLTASNEYQPIYAFGHNHPTQLAEFLQLHTDETVLELTAEHLVFVPDEDHPVRADSLKVGDSLRAASGTSAQTITKIRTVERQGLYTPFTPQGTVLVDGIAASSYVSLQDEQNLLLMKNGFQLPLSQHGFVHLGMAPLRLLCLGVSSSYCHKLRYNDQGLPSYVAWAIDTSLWVTEQSVLVQALILALYLVVMVPLVAAETLFGPSRAPLALFALGTGYLCWRRNKPTNKQKIV